MSTARRLIVNADDYGLTRGVSRGIREAHQGGIVSSTTAMMNMPRAVEDLQIAMRETPHLGLGVHLVLSAGRPTLPPDHIPSLVSASVAFLSLDELTLARTRLDPEQVRREWRAQIERFIVVTGNGPDHLDSHHHTSYFSSGLFRTMLELAREYGCAIRNPLRTLDGGGLAADIEQEFAAFGAPLLGEFSPRASDFFVASFYDEGARLPDLLSIMGRLPAGTTELMCHPAQVDKDLRAVSGYVSQRGRELAVLTDPAPRLALAKGRIELSSFGEID